MAKITGSNSQDIIQQLQELRNVKIFFGKEAEIDDIIETVRNRRRRIRLIEFLLPVFSRRNRPNVR